MPNIEGQLHARDGMKPNVIEKQSDDKKKRILSIFRRPKFGLNAFQVN